MSATRFFRNLLSIGALLALALFVGALFMRHKVINRVGKRNLGSASVVLSRSIPISRGTNIDTLRVLTRLKRLGYQAANGSTKVAGEYSLHDNLLEVFVRENQNAQGQNTPEERLAIQLDENHQVVSIQKLPEEEAKEVWWLEPEPVSYLGTSSTRSSTPRRLEEFPPYLINALLSIEDERFYHHFGIDPIAVSRAFVHNMAAGHVVEGGSTITQQLAKNLFFTRQRSFVRKIFEAFSAILIETAFTKKQILEFYANEVFLGQVGQVAIHGFGEAAKSFFATDVDSITLAEAATLAGIIKAPSAYSPRNNPERAVERRNLVLQKMAELGYINEHQRAVAAAEELIVRPAPKSNRVAPYFVDSLRKQLMETFDIDYKSPGEIQVHTGLDLEYQDCAQTALENGLKEVEKNFPKLKREKNPLQSALISIVPASGEIRAWVGGRDYGDSQFDRVTQAHRQPGSSFKPFVYLTALDHSLNNYRVARTTSILVDEPIELKNVDGAGTNWRPENYDEKFRGEVTVRQALSFSLNIPTVQLALKVGMPSIAHTAALFGFGDNLPPVPALALGAGEVTPYAEARAYSALANGGVLVTPRDILSLTAPNETAPLYLAQLNEQRVASEDAVYVLTSIMQSVMEVGTGAGARARGFLRPAAGKTGTSNDTRDSWFAGFTPSLLTVVWVGFDDNAKTGLTGASGALPIWTEYMKCVTPMEPELDFVPPPGVVFLDVDSKSGLLWDPACGSDNRLREVFVRGTEPVTSCTSAPSTSPLDLIPLPAREGMKSFWNRLFGN